MPIVVGVRFKSAGKIYYFDPGQTGAGKGDDVIVETARGLEYGEVVVGPREVLEATVVMPLKIVMRKANADDKHKIEQNHEREKEAFALCEKKIKEHKLPMNLVDVEFTFDVNKIIFYFTADGRIDFRELVKDLASVFRTRIELRQIGVRDEAKMLGGIGTCGRILCCNNFLGEFAPVSIKMAKNQGLSLNPAKISGVCGRLMCCLRYENDQYTGDHSRKKCCCGAQESYKMFRVGMKVITDEGEGQVVYVNLQKHSVKVQLEGGRTKTMQWDVVESVENE